MKEKKIFRQSIFAIIITAAIFASLFLVIFQITDRRFHFEVPNASSYQKIEMDREDIVRIEQAEVIGDSLHITVEPISKGNAALTITFEDDFNNVYVLLSVSSSGIITNKNNGSFSCSDQVIMFSVLFIICFSIIMWINFGRAKKHLYFSYQTMFYGGFAIWVSIVTILETWIAFSELSAPDHHSINNFIIPSFFNRLSSAGTTLMLVLTPFLLLFAIFMIISNISLMKHESKRRTNAVGMTLGIIMIAIEAILILILGMNFSGSENMFRLYNIITHSLTAVFSVAECLLLGAIICGFLSALHEPRYDRDFVIILGCKIKKDGTLFPLVRGRVDRAIQFFHAQDKASGKKPILLPSGGQGSDEILSEGEAMKRYILGQGIPEEYVIAETKSKNTLENMKFSGAIIQERKKDAKIAFSTTNFHVFRSGILSVKAGLIADGMGSPTKWYFWPNAFIREFFGLIAYCRKKIIFLTALIIFILALLEILY